MRRTVQEAAEKCLHPTLETNMDNTKPLKEIVLIKEGFIRSIVADVVTYGSILGLLFFNHQFLSGSTWVDVIFIVIAVIFAITRGSSRVHRFTSSQDAADWLQQRGD